MSSPSSLAVHRRRRSHSISESSPSPSPVPWRHLDSTWPLAGKRAFSQRPASPRNLDSSSPQQWDVERWRGAKRLRRHKSPESDDDNDNDDDDLDIQMHSRAFVAADRRGGSMAAVSAPSTPPFPSTPAEFHLPKRDRRNRRSSSRYNPLSKSSGDGAHIGRGDLERLRSNAFWELRRSIEDGGEGFVSRMRDWENSHRKSGDFSSSFSFQRRARERSSPTSGGAEADNEGRLPEDEDDVQIFSGASAESHFPWISRKKRAHSLSWLGPVSPRVSSSSSDGSNAYTSPVETCLSTPSIYPSDTELNDDIPCIDTNYQFSFESPQPPPLSSAHSSSSNSSVVSLSLPSTFRKTSLELLHSPPHSPSQNALPSGASRSEKAIAALALAMANGAGGVNDYALLQALQSPPLLEECHAGDLWR